MYNVYILYNYSNQNVKKMMRNCNRKNDVRWYHL